jgi:hypothetical protein
MPVDNVTGTETTPTNTDLQSLLSLAEQHLQKSEIDQALLLIDQLMARSDVPADLAVGLADLVQKITGDTEKTTTYLNRCLDLGVDPLVVLHRLGLLCHPETPTETSPATVLCRHLQARRLGKGSTVEPACLDQVAPTILLRAIETTAALQLPVESIRLMLALSRRGIKVDQRAWARIFSDFNRYLLVGGANGAIAQLQREIEELLAVADRAELRYLQAAVAFFCEELAEPDEIWRRQAGVGDSRVSFIMSICMWGEAFVQTALQRLLPSLMAPGNLEALSHDGIPVIQIYTSAADLMRMSSTPVIQSLRRQAGVRISILPDAMVAAGHSSEFHLEPGYINLGLTYSISGRRALRLGATLGIANADWIYAPGSLGGAAALMSGERSMVLGNIIAMDRRRMEELGLLTNDADGSRLVPDWSRFRQCFGSRIANSQIRYGVNAYNDPLNPVYIAVGDSLQEYNICPTPLLMKPSMIERAPVMTLTGPDNLVAGYALQGLDIETYAAYCCDPKTCLVLGAEEPHRLGTELAACDFRGLPQLILRSVAWVVGINPNPEFLAWVFEQPVTYPCSDQQSPPNAQSVMSEVASVVRAQPQGCCRRFSSQPH